MTSSLKHRRHRFDALHTLLTGLTRPAHPDVPPSLRRDVGLPESRDPQVPWLLDPTWGASRHRA
jgi:hypothetical protein